MANLTLAIDDDVLRAARIKAVQQGTSVNEICREAIERYAAPADEADAFMAELRAISRRMARTARPAQATWPDRTAMYDEAMAERFPTLWATLESEAAPAAAAPGKRK